MKRALICGVSGQDGAYLAKLLVDKGYKVFGTSRDAQLNSFSNLKRLGVYDAVETHSMALTDFRSVIQVISRVEPDEIYHLAGQTSVGLSFEQPVETFESIVTSAINLLEAIRFLNPKIRFFNAASSECFGNSMLERPATEQTPFYPRSPYAVAKAAAFWQTANYRESYDLFATSGIVFNHESPLRPERFVTKKIVSAASRISKGNKEKLRMGNLEIVRDWGWAPEYVEAMYMMLQQVKPDDFIIATGQSYSLKEFLMKAFGFFDLDWQDHVEVVREFFRPSELLVSRGNPEKIRRMIGWSASTSMSSIINNMINEII